jgi:murein DD-endopeptidase MepM/ murein hydrolase activator NlpD
MFHYRLVKRRKPLLGEPLIPSIKTVNKKYRSGSLAGKFIRHISEYKDIRKIFAGNMAALVILASFLPSTGVSAKGSDIGDETIIESQTSLVTERGIQIPLETLKINQGYSFFHPGVDLDGNTGDPIKSIKMGRVIEAGYRHDGYGNMVLIDHGGGLESLYAHLSKIEVTVGEQVDMNTEIGKVGVTGHSTGSHLHLEILQNGKDINPFSILPR